MTDRPILMSGPMVRAILDGRKTQTRRVARKQPGFEADGCHRAFPAEAGSTWWDYWAADRPGALRFKVPYAIGDRLWVRERWRAGRGYDGASIKDMSPQSRIWFDADESNDNADAIGKVARPSIHMPRWASRLTLLVTDVRVERLQDISGSDAVAEGVRSWLPDNGVAVAEFMDLWDSLNAVRGFGWSDNPWVVAVSFEPRQANIDRMAVATDVRPERSDLFTGNR